MRCVCLCLCLPVSLCLLALVRRGLFSALEEVQEGEGMCLAAAGVGFDCLAEQGTTWAMFCVWGYVCSLSWHSWSSVSVCMSNDSSAPACGTACRLTAFLCVWVMEALFNTIHFVFLENPCFWMGWVALFWEGLWQDGEQNSEEKYREAVCLVRIGFGVFGFSFLNLSSSKEKAVELHRKEYVEHHRWSQLGFLPRWIKKGGKPRRCVDLLQVQ